ncbi:MAG: ABC transporter permease [Nitrososphaerota archaeon]|nr:ABC transporter permease [Nitrososphaerota archaeon]
MISSYTLLDFIIAVIGVGISYTTIYLAASLGEIFSEKGGVMNLALEGIMAMGAFVAYGIAFNTGNVYLGVVAGIVTGMMMGLLFGFLAITIRINQVLAGLSVWLVGYGISYFIYELTYNRSLILLHSPTLPTVPIPYLVSIPYIGQALFNHTIIDYIVYLIVPLLWYIMFKTKWGLKIIAVGENPRAADSVGIGVNKVRYLVVLFGSAMAGLAGAIISLEVGLFIIGITGGRGFIAVGIAVFSGFNPLYGLLASLLFGVVSAVGPSLAIIGIRIPYEFLDMLPFLLLIVAAMIIARRLLTPSALSMPYQRE